MHFISGFFHAHSPRKRAISTISSPPPTAMLNQPIQWNWLAPPTCAARTPKPATARIKDSYNRRRVINLSTILIII